MPGPGEMANKFNEYFASLYYTSENLQSIPQHDVLQKLLMTSRCWMTSTSRKRWRCVNSRACGRIKPPVLMTCRHDCCHIQEAVGQPLTAIFQKSLQSGVFPQDWKLTNVTPIYKKGSRGQSCNYRSVSQTSQVCKLFESIIRDVTVDHLEKSELIRDSQHGFRRGRSCLSNLLVFLGKVT
jgi:hypothetical protein